MTLFELITDALVGCGYLPEGEEPDADAAQAAIRRLNGMLGVWSNDHLMVPYISGYTFNVLEQQQATLGVFGNYAMRDPLSIVCLIMTDPYMGTYEVKQSNEDQVRLMYDANLKGTVPQCFAFIEGAVPSLLFSSVPPAGCSMRIRVLHPFDPMTELTETVEFPSGYTEALTLGLIISLGATRYGRTASPDVVALFQQAYSGIRHMRSVNRKPGCSVFEPGLLNTSARGW